MIEPKRKSPITDHRADGIDQKANGIYAIHHESEEERDCFVSIKKLPIIISMLQ